MHDVFDLVPTCADAGPDLYILCYDGCHWQHPTMMVFLPQPLTQKLHFHLQRFHPLQLVPVVFSLPLTGADTGLTLGQLIYTVWWWFLAVVVVDVCVCDHGGCK